MNIQWSAVFDLPIPGWHFGILCVDGVLVESEFLPATTPLLAPAGDCGKAVGKALGEYFSVRRKPFDLPVVPAGTKFQQRVWRALQAIPPGQPCSYGELARLLGSCARAVASACRTNPVPLVIPCHRVVAKQGPGGFMGALSGAPVELKKALLAHEAGT